LNAIAVSSNKKPPGEERPWLILPGIWQGYP
jgi:hypothetical protein